MEPLTILNLFCNIVDICDHAIKVCKASTEIYRSVKGRRTRDEELLTYFGQLEEILRSVRVSSSRLNRDSLYEAIVGPLGRMEAKSAAVKDMLDEFRASKPGNRLSTVIATAKVVRGQGKLDRMLQDLKQCRDDVHFAIAQSTRQDAIGLDGKTRDTGNRPILDSTFPLLYSTAFSDESPLPATRHLVLDEVLLTCISIQIAEVATYSRQLSKGQVDIQFGLTSLDSRIQKLDKDLTEVPDIVAKAKEVSNEVHTELCAMSILSRLGNTNQRYWDVTEADSHTFHWILADEAGNGLAMRDGEQDSNSKDDEVSSVWKRNARLEYEKTQSDVNGRLRNWLLHGSGLFHISGKPGSGKSTLMKYLAQHPKVRSSLEDWTRPKRLALGKFFFWKPDHGQNSLEALMRGLLYSVIHYNSELVHSAFPKHSEGSYEQLSMRSKLEMTKDEIFEGFENLIRDNQASKRFSFCFFIDGLDELDEEGDTTHSRIVTTLRQWTDSAGVQVKVCVSSRHFPVFENMPVDQRIVLQDLTKYDMVKFVYHSLRPHQVVPSTTIAIAEDYHELVRDIVERSDGIFLWVSLVMRSIERGVSNGDSIAVLRERVRKTPKGLEQLFKSLFDSIEDCHAHMALILLAIALAWSSSPRHRISLPDLSLSACRNFFHARETSTGDRTYDIFKAENSPEAFRLTSDVVLSTKSKILFQCKGMLEIVPAQTDKDSKHEQYIGGRVIFLHRSIPESLRKWVPERMETEGLRASHIQKAMCWMIWAEIHFLNSAIHSQQLPVDDQRPLRIHIALITYATLANLGTHQVSKADLSASFHLLDLAEDALLPAIMCLPTQEEKGEDGNLEGHTWNSMSHTDSRCSSSCLFLPTPLNIAAMTGSYAYVSWRVPRESPSVLQNNYFQHCLHTALDVLDPYKQEYSEGETMDCINTATALIKTMRGDINSMARVFRCGCNNAFRCFQDFQRARALPSLFDAIWISFLFHSLYHSANFQQEVFCMIETFLVRGAIPRSVFCVGTARDWFVLPSSPSESPELKSDQLGTEHQIRGCILRIEGCDSEKTERLTMICGQDDDIVTLEKVVAYAKPRNMTAILSLIESNSQIEDAKPSAAIELTTSQRFQAAELKKHGARGDEFLVWLERQ